MEDSNNAGNDDAIRKRHNDHLADLLAAVDTRDTTTFPAHFIAFLAISLPDNALEAAKAIALEPHVLTIFAALGVEAEIIDGHCFHDLSALMELFRAIPSPTRHHLWRIPTTTLNIYNPLIVAAGMHLHEVFTELPNIATSAGRRSDFALLLLTGLHAASPALDAPMRLLLSLLLVPHPRTAATAHLPCSSGNAWTTTEKS